MSNPILGFSPAGLSANSSARESMPNIDANHAESSVPTQTLCPVPYQSPAPMNANPYQMGQTYAYPYVAQDPAFSHAYQQEFVKTCGYIARKEAEVIADIRKEENHTRAAIARSSRTLKALCDGKEIVMVSQYEGGRNTIGKIPCPSDVRMLKKADDPNEKVLAVRFQNEGDAQDEHCLHKSKWTSAGVRMLFLVSLGATFRNISSGIKREEYDALLALLIEKANENAEEIPLNYGWQGHGAKLRRVVRGRDQIWEEVRAKCK